MDKYVCEILVRKDSNGKIVNSGGKLYTETIIVQANSETYAQQTALSKYAREHNVSTFNISVGKVKKM